MHALAGRVALAADAPRPPGAGRAAARSASRGDDVDAAAVASRARRGRRVRRHPRDAARVGRAARRASATTPRCSTCPRASGSSRAPTRRSRTCTSGADWLTPREIGARAAAAALSDLAAMAAAPLGLLLALGVPPAWRGELDALARRRRRRRAPRATLPDRRRQPHARERALAHDHRARHAPRARSTRDGRACGRRALRHRHARRPRRRAARAAARRDAARRRSGAVRRAAAAHRRGALARRARRHARRSTCPTASSPTRGTSPRRAACALELDRRRASVRRRASTPRAPRRVARSTSCSSRSGGRASDDGRVPRARSAFRSRAIGRVDGRRRRREPSERDAAIALTSPRGPRPPFADAHRPHGPHGARFATLVLAPIVIVARLLGVREGEDGVCAAVHAHLGARHAASRPA